MQAQPIKFSFLRIPAACAASGLSRTPLYRHISEGLMTRPVKLTGRATALPAHEVEAINAARIRGATDDEIRALVKVLHDQRRQAGQALA